MEKKFGVFSSSVDPQKLSMTVQSIILGGSALIVFFGAKLGYALTSGDIQAIASSAGAFAAQVGIAISAIGTIYGLVRKGIVWLAEKKGV